MTTGIAEPNKGTGRKRTIDGLMPDSFDSEILKTLVLFVF